MQMPREVHVTESGLAQCLIQHYSHRISKIKGSDISYHGNSDTVLPVLNQNLLGYSRTFLSEHDMTVTIVIYDGETLGLRDRLFREIREIIDPDRPELLSDTLCMSNICSESAPHEDLIIESPRKARKFPSPRKGSAKEYAAVCSEAMLGSAMPGDLDDFLKQEDEGFRGMLIRKISDRGWTDAFCYRKANIDRRLFNHIINDPTHHPKKKTVFAFILALELDEDEAVEMLRKAGYAFAPTLTDKIVLWCVRHNQHDVNTVNEILFSYDQELLS